MPCYEPRDHCPPSNTELLSTLEERLDDMEQKVDMLTDYLCTVGKCMLHKKQFPIHIMRWWQEHSELDKQRGEPW